MFLRLLPYLEQRPLYDAMNFQVNIFTAINATVSATGIATLWCPSDSGTSDPQTVPDGDFYDPGPFTMYYTSYAGNIGTWHMGWSPQYNDRLNGLFNADGAVRMASVTDGLSNTIAFGEHARAILAPADQLWTSTGGLGLPERHALHHALPDESAEVDDRALDDFEHAYWHGGIEPAPRRLQFRVPGWLGPVPQGDDRLLEDRPGHRVARRHLLRFDRSRPCRPGDAVRGLPGPLDPQRRRGDRLQLLLIVACGPGQQVPRSGRRQATTLALASRTLFPIDRQQPGARPAHRLRMSPRAISLEG